jgi:hypothetical protein
MSGPSSDSLQACAGPVSLLLVTLLLPGCTLDTVHPPVPDMAPIGAGLRFIGIGIVVTALVLVLGTSRNP